MRLFCVSDIHSYFTPFKNALDEKGFEAASLAEILPFSFSAKKHMGA